MRTLPAGSGIRIPCGFVKRQALATAPEADFNGAGDESRSLPLLFSARQPDYPR